MIPIFGINRDMSTVHEIIDTLGGVNSAATKLATPQQTVSEWYHRKPPEIPPWRRPAVAQTVEQLGVQLSKEAREYLASTARTPKARESAAA